MIPEYWSRQEPGKPLFPDLLWSRPENRQFAGKLAVIGGNFHGFVAPGLAYSESERAGVGLTRVLLPQAVKKLTGHMFEHLEFASSNPSGSFSQRALADWLSLANWADGTLQVGDLGRNSETAIVFEQFLEKHSGQVTITKDAVDYALTVPHLILNRPDTLLVLSMAQLQKLGIASGTTVPITLGTDLVRLVDILHNLTGLHGINIITKHHDTLIVAAGGTISTTKLIQDMDVWRVLVATHAAVWWLQNPAKLFESLTVAVAEVAGLTSKE